MLISAAAPAEKVLVFMNPAVTVKENYEFRRIYRKGKSEVSPQLVIYCQRNRRGLSRLGVSVSTKLGGAVVRNRVRRRIREIYRLNKPKMVPGYDIIVVARVRAVETGYQKLESTYLRLLRQLNLLREDRHEAGHPAGHPVLSGVRVAAVSAPLPVYPHLLGIRPAGGGEIRAAAGRLYGAAALSAMQSLPQRRV